MRYEWDEGKRETNARKHGIDFRDVPAVFEGPMLSRQDDRTTYGEERWIGLGLLGTGIVVVVYTDSDDEVIRIISARKANRRERTRFEESLVDGLGPLGRSVGR